MDAKDLFLLQHSAVHSIAVGGNPASAAERTFGGLSDDQWRVRPREDLNSVAWIMFHIARAEDIIVNPVIAGRDQVFSDAWARRLGITRRDFGIRMTSAEVTELTGQLHLAALREYRDAVGTHTREVVGAFKEGDWNGTVPNGSPGRAATEGAFGAGRELVVRVQSGRPRADVLRAIAIFHCFTHMGEAVTIRSAGGFWAGALDGSAHTAGRDNEPLWSPAHQLQGTRLASELLPGRDRALGRRRLGVGADAVARGAAGGVADPYERVSIPVMPDEASRRGSLLAKSGGPSS